MDFVPDSLSGATLDYFNGWSSNSLSNEDAGRCFNAGVNLPNGARIKSIRFFYQSDATSDFYGTLVRANPATGTSSRIAEVTPANDADVRTSASDNIALAKQPVKNASFQYGVGVCPFDGTTFLGARITYTYKNAGDYPAIAAHRAARVLPGAPSSTPRAPRANEEAGPCGPASVLHLAR